MTATRPGTATRLRSVGAGDSAVDRVAAEIRRAVLDGTLPPGSTFSITALSADLGVSHIPVREALRRLDAQGLVVLRPGRSAMVSPLDRDELHSIFRLRRILEPDLASRSVSLLTRADIELAENLLEQYVHGTDSPDALWDVHHELHLTLIRPAASAWDLRLLAQLWTASDRYTRIVFDTFAVSEPDRTRRAHVHSDLLDAAKSGVSERMRTALTAHLNENEAACIVGIAALSAHPGPVAGDDPPSSSAS